MDISCSNVLEVLLCRGHHFYDVIIVLGKQSTQNRIQRESKETSVNVSVDVFVFTRFTVCCYMWVGSLTCTHRWTVLFGQHAEALADSLLPSVSPRFCLVSFICHCSFRNQICFSILVVIYSFYDMNQSLLLLDNCNEFFFNISNVCFNLLKCLCNKILKIEWVIYLYEGWINIRKE